MTQNFAQRAMMIRAESRVEDTRKQLKSNIEWTIRHLQEELQRLDAHNTVSTLECSAIRDLPKNADAFHMAKEVLADLRTALETEQANAA